MKDPTCASKAVKEAQVNLIEDEGYPLHFACDSGGDNLSAVQLLFNAYPEAILEDDGYGRTALERARETEDTDVISFLEKQLVYAEKAQDMNTMS